jgi:cardiolipin synthase
MAFLAAHVLSLTSFVLALLLVARASEQRRPTGSMLGWLLAIVLVPYIGVPLYLLLGGRKLRSRAASKEKLRAPRAALALDQGRLATMLCASGAAPPSHGNALALLTSGEKAFAEIFQLIESARATICVSTLIFADDVTGRAIARALADKSRGGVQVRVLIDALFEFRASRRLISVLRASGVQVAWFMPIWGLGWRRNANLRLHRKVVLVDTESAIVGGMNLAVEYLGEAPLASRWRDLSLRVTGPAARDIADVFASDWQFASGEVLPEAGAVPRASAEQGSREVQVQVVGSGPDVESDRIYDAVLSGAFDARQRLWVATPYFVPDEALLRALVLASRRGVDVRVVVPRRSNHLTADLAGASYLRALAREGGVVQCYGPEMLHAKLVLIDTDVAILGSANMDMRSLFLDYEIALVVTSARHVAELETWYEAVLARSVDLAAASRGRALLESLARLLAPLE